MVEIANSTAEGKGHGLLCPACRVDLVMSERQGIEIDYCPKCSGVWLDRGELDKIIERSASDEARAVPTQPNTPQPAPPRGQPYPSQGYYESGHGSGHGGHGPRPRSQAIVPRRTLRLTKLAGRVEGTPPEVDIALLERKLLSISGVTAVHDLHVWTITSGIDAMSCHLVVADMSQARQTLVSAQEAMRAGFGLRHATSSSRTRTCARPRAS